MKAKDGDKFDLQKVNLSELVRRTGIPRKKLRRLKENNFVFKPHGNTGRKAEVTVMSGYTGVVDDLLESKKCREQWHSYIDSLKRYDDIIDSLNRYEKSARKETEIAKTREQIANTVLQGKKDFIKDSSYEKLLSNENHRSIDDEKGKIYKDPSIVRDRLSSRNPEPNVKRLINGLLAKRQKEIEQEIEEYLDLGRDKGYEMSL